MLRRSLLMPHFAPRALCASMTFVVFVTLGGVPRVAAAQAAQRKANARSVEQLALQLEHALATIEAGESESPRDRWDPAYVVEHTGREHEALFAWVRDNTRWVPYRGLLKGARGVLMDRVGSSLDRAVLLATLLREAGHEVRLAHGDLPRERVGELLPRLLVSRRLPTRAAPGADPPASHTPDPLARVAADYELDETRLRDTFARAGEVASSLSEQMLARSSNQAQRLLRAIGHQPAEAELVGGLTAASRVLRDHWWVQRREGDAWFNLDPLDPGAKPGDALARARETFALDALPDAHRHTIELRVVGERWSEGVLSQSVALEHTLRPADLIGVPVVLRFSPLAWPEELPPAGVDGETYLRRTALAQTEWLPTLVQGPELISQSSLLDSAVLNRSPQRKGLDSAGGSTSDTIGRVIDLFGGGAQEPPKPGILTAVWLEWEIHSPGAKPRRVSREIFDLLAAGGRAAKPVVKPAVGEAQRLERSLALLTETDVLPLVCKIPSEFVTHLLSQSLLANRDVLDAIVRDEIPNDLAGVRDVALALAPPPSPLFALATGRHLWSRVDRATYYDRPNLVTSHAFFERTGARFALRGAIDIVANQMGVRWDATDRFAVRLEQGVVDTNAEALVVMGGGGGENTAEAYAATPDEHWARSTQNDSSALSGLGVEARARAAEALANGYWVVAPRAPIALGSRPFEGFWRVDPAGHTLGMGSRGWGVSLVEAALLLALGAFFFAGFLSFLDCMLGLSPVTSGDKLDMAVSPFTPAPVGPGGEKFTRGAPGAAGECFYFAVKAGLIAAFLAVLLAGLTGILSSGAQPGGGRGGGGGGGAGGGGGGGGGEAEVAAGAGAVEEAVLVVPLLANRGRLDRSRRRASLLIHLGERLNRIWARRGTTRGRLERERRDPFPRIRRSTR